MNKILSSLGMAWISNNLVYGEKLMLAISSKKTNLVIMANDVSINNEKKIINKTSFYNVKLIKMFNRIEISKAIGKENIIAVGILDKTMAEKILQEIEV